MRARRMFSKLALVGMLVCALGYWSALPAAAQSTADGSSSIPAMTDEVPDATASDAPQDAAADAPADAPAAAPAKPLPTPAPNPYQGLPTGC